MKLIEFWLRSITEFCTRPWVKSVILTLYFLAILIGLILLYGKGDFSTQSFVYQGF